MNELKEEDIISLIKDKKMSFIDILHYLYLKDSNNRLEHEKIPIWFNNQQQKWIREAFTILEKASNN